MQGVHSYRYNVDGIGVSDTPNSPGGLSKRRSVDNIFPLLPSYFSRSSSRRSPSPFSRSASRRSPSPTPSSLYRSISRKSAELTGHPGASPASLSRNTSRRSTTPIMYSNSTGIPVKPPAVEKKLECTLEELCFGCTKKIKITRDAITSSGQLIQDEEVLSIKVKPGWKKGTKITFEGKGNEVPGTQPADIIFLVAEKRHHLFRRDGDDLELAVEIPLVKALTGCTISVPLLGGEKMDLSIDDEIIHPGYVKMIEGQGMPTKDPEGARGNLKLLFLVDFPTELTDEQRSNVLGILEDCC
ncbi:DnaJ C domain-containing protein [Citrus sinensis]|nr:dnaJ homolog subfamily B member 13 [Citrus x clementina]XP_006473023.2 uncharacterized protein LOC102624484 [Citrus sinensis]KAH9691241.1 DnaJ C domain-containing protein [Citrus sinensis]